MSRNIVTAVDVGTSTVQTVVAEKKRGDEHPRILGVGTAPSAGVRRGAVVDLGDAAESIRASVEEASRAAGVPIRSVVLGIGGTHISVSSSRGVVAVSRADGEISQEDVTRAVRAAESFLPKNPNKEVLHLIPRYYKVDNETGIKDPIGMHGVRLEVDTLIVECSGAALKNLFKAVEMAGLRTADYVFSSYAASYAVLTKRQKELGALLLDIGGGTTSFIVFEEGVPIHAGIVPIGGNHITNDVAIGFRTHIDIAERIKTAYGACLPHELPKRESIRLAEFVEGSGVSYFRRELAEIVEARLKDIFELIHKELKRVARTELLPAGVIIVGGVSRLPGLVELAKREVRLPAELGMPYAFSGSMDQDTVRPLAVPLGIIEWAYAEGESGGLSWARTSGIGQSSWVRWLKSLLP